MRLSLSYKTILGIFIGLLLFSSCRTTRQAVVTNSNSTPGTTEVQKCAEILGITICGTENTKLLSEAASWIGTPYLYAGCTKDGTDCSCLTMNIYKNVYGKTLSRTSAEMYEKDVTKIDISEAKEGDLIFFKISSDKPGHVGIYLKDGKFIHASTSKGVVTSSITESYWSQHYLGCGRVN